MDLKYDVLKHPNVELSGDGKAKSYIHGQITESTGSINVDFSDVIRIENQKELTKKEQKLLDEYEIISSEEIDKYFKNKEGIKNEESK